MNLNERFQLLQQRADQCAIQEANLREQIEGLEDLKRQLETANRQKHQLIGALSILKEQIEEEQAAAAPKSGPVGLAEAPAGKAKKAGK